MEKGEKQLKNYQKFPYIFLVPGTPYLIIRLFGFWRFLFCVTFRCVPFYYKNTASALTAAVFLVAAFWFIGDGHFDQAFRQGWVEVIFAKCRAV